MYKEKLQMLLLDQFKSVAYIMMNRKGKLSSHKIQLTPKVLKRMNHIFSQQRCLLLKLMKLICIFLACKNV
jgi:hypothetical protein